MKFYLLFCLFFTLIATMTVNYEEGELTYDGNIEVDKENTKSTSYKIKFSTTLTQEYLHFKIISSSDYNQLVLISKDKQCQNERKALGLQADGPINLFIKKEDINIDSLYLCVKCEKEETCSYKISIKEESEYELSFGEQTSYFVNNTNKEVNIKFNHDDTEPNNLRYLDTVNTWANIWVKGQSISSAKLSKNGKNIEGKSFGYGFIFMIEDLDLNTDYELNVKSEVGDYVTVGSYTIDDDTSSNSLVINNLEIMGILNKEKNNKVCFPIYTNLSLLEDEEIIYAQINGIVYTKKAQTYVNVNGKDIEDEPKNIIHGLIYDFTYIKKRDNTLYCITSPKNDTKISYTIFSIQLTSSNIDNYNNFIYGPQLPGVIYSHYLPKGGIAVFRGMKPKKGATEMNYVMKSLRGYPDMLYDRAIDFPYGIYNETTIKDCKNPHNANRITVFSIYLNESDYSYFDPLTSVQPLLIVHCLEGTNEEEAKSIFCEFETTIFSDVDRVNLVEEESFSQYLLEGEKDLYTINIQNEVDLEKVYLDLIIFSGDVNFEIDSGDKNAHKYYLSNKIFYSIQIKENENDKQINFTVTAQKNSFYLIMYKLVTKGDDSKNIDRIESGVNYIQSIYIGEAADYMKYVVLQNFKSEQLSPYLVNFYSQNCQFSISRTLFNEDDGSEEGEQFIPMYDNYGQLMIDENDKYFGRDEYMFKIYITGDDVSEYNKKLCMLYVTGLEYSNSSSGSERTVSISEGVPQYYIYSDKYPYMKYTYYTSNVDNDVVVDLNLIDKGIFNVKIISNYIQMANITIFRNGQVIITRENLTASCLDNKEVCPIDVFIELKGGEEIRLETTIYQVTGAPIYLEKNVVKQDIVLSPTRKLYYIDIGSGDSGDITIDYIRGSGYIFAKIVNKTEPEKNVEKYDWRGMYVFPKRKEESLPYITYLKKIDITSEKTKYCDNGCYILITVEISVYDNETERNSTLVPYRITITPRINPTGFETSELLVPKVKMSLNQFISGNLYQTKEKILTYYQVTLPYDSDYVYFDWQADKPSLFINIGEKRPTNDTYDLHFEAIGHDTVLVLSKEQIIETAKNNNKEIPFNDTLKNVILTLGLWTNYVDTLYTAMYAFKISMPQNFSGIGDYERSITDIIHIRSDQKVQCVPHKNKNGYFTCVFAVVFDEGDVNKNVVVYPRAQKDNVEVNFIGRLVDAGQIARNNFTYIQEELNSEYPQFASDSKKYIYHKGIDKQKCILFSVNTSEYSIIEVMSTIYSLTNDQIVYPNPSTAQVYSIEDKTIFLSFETTKDLIINIVSINGEGQIYWEVDKEKNINSYLYGFEDRLALTTGTSSEVDKYSNLVIQSSSFTLFDDAGFVFLITFYPRNENYNYDQLKIGRSTEFSYRDTTFPINYYSILSGNEVDINLAFYNYFIEKDTQLEYDKSSFSVWGKVISEEDATKALITDYYRPKKDNSVISGSFDGAFVSLYFNEENIKSFNVDEATNRYLFFTVERNEETKLNMKGMSLEVSLLKAKENDDEKIYPHEYVYTNGNLFNKKNNRIVYQLKTNKIKSYMRIEFAANSDYVKWDLAKDEELKDKIKEGKKYLNGRYIVSFKVEDNTKPIYLVVYKEDNKNFDHKLGNYVFKYMNLNVNTPYNFINFNDDKIECKIKENNGKKSYFIEFYPVEYHDINYFIKAIYNDTQIKDEKKDTIAITESDGHFVQINNPDFEGNKKINVTFEMSSDKEISYIKILGKANFEVIKEYFLYKPLDFSESQDASDTSDTTENNKGSNKLLIVFIIVGILFVIIVIVLVIFVIYYKSKNKGLLEQVNKISFANNEQRDKDKNLLYDDEHLK